MVWRYFDFSATKNQIARLILTTVLVLESTKQGRGMLRFLQIRTSLMDLQSLIVAKCWRWELQRAMSMDGCAGTNSLPYLKLVESTRHWASPDFKKGRLSAVRVSSAISTCLLHQELSDRFMRGSAAVASVIMKWSEIATYHARSFLVQRSVTTSCLLDIFNFNCLTSSWNLQFNVERWCGNFMFSFQRFYIVPHPLATLGACNMSERWLDVFYMDFSVIAFTVLGPTLCLNSRQWASPDFNKGFQRSECLQ